MLACLSVFSARVVLDFADDPSWSVLWVLVSSGLVAMVGLSAKYLNLGEAIFIARRLVTFLNKTENGGGYISVNDNKVVIRRANTDRIYWTSRSDPRKWSVGVDTFGDITADRVPHLGRLRWGTHQEYEDLAFEMARLWPRQPLSSTSRKES
jgi:hypothetical protein